MTETHNTLNYYNAPSWFGHYLLRFCKRHLQLRILEIASFKEN